MTGGENFVFILMSDGHQRRRRPAQSRAASLLKAPAPAARRNRAAPEAVREPSPSALRPRTAAAAATAAVTGWGGGPRQRRRFIRRCKQRRRRRQLTTRLRFFDRGRFVVLDRRQRASWIANGFSSSCFGTSGSSSPLIRRGTSSGAPASVVGRGDSAWAAAGLPSLIFRATTPPHRQRMPPITIHPYWLLRVTFHAPLARRGGAWTAARARSAGGIFSSPRARPGSSHSPAGQGERRAQLGAARAWVASHFFLAGLDRLARQLLPPRPVAEGLLDAPVFQRVEADHGRPPARPQALRQCRQQALQGAQFVVDRDPQRLKHPRGGVDGRLLPGRPCAAAAAHSAAPTPRAGRSFPAAADFRVSTMRRAMRRLNRSSP